jgi:phosphonoacetaldehyde hydrolase
MQTIKLVVFDWAGTAIDHGSFAPVVAFVQAFARQSVQVTPTEARGPMGLHKKDHIRALLQEPVVAQRWHQAQGRDWSEADVEILYREFIPLQLEVIDAHSGLIPGLLEAVAWLRERGIRVGATTGYFREAAERVYRSARRQGFVPDHCICAEEVPVGRPAPWMIYRIMEAVNVYPPAAVAKVGDTEPDIAEGRNAGVWSVGVVRTGNELGCTEAEWQAMPGAVRQERLEAARHTLMQAGAHAAVESVADLPDLISGLESRAARGERP